MPIESFNKAIKLFLAYIRRRAASEVCEPELPTLKSARATIDFILFNESLEVKLYLGRVLVRVDFEIAKLAALSAERNMYVETKRIVSTRRLIERLDCKRDIFRFPLRKRRICGDKIIADLRLGIRQAGSNLYRRLTRSGVRVHKG